MANPVVRQAAPRVTDLPLLPGTLHVRLPQPTEANLGGNAWRGNAPNHIGIRCGEVLMAGRYRGSVCQGDEPEYPPAQGEIMSDHHPARRLGRNERYANANSRYPSATTASQRVRKAGWPPL
jgi:hypothetical protein